MNGHSVIILFDNEDINYVKEAEKHLVSLKEDGRISVWHHWKIAPGSNWKEETDKNIGSASIILLMLSPSFVSSVPKKNQIKIAELHKNNTAVIPIRVRPVNWEFTAFTNLQYLPRNAIPVSQWPDQDSAWSEIVREIAQLLDLRKVPTPVSLPPPDALASPEADKPSEIAGSPPHRSFKFATIAFLLILGALLFAGWFRLKRLPNPAPVPRDLAVPQAPDLSQPVPPSAPPAIDCKKLPADMPCVTARDSQNGEATYVFHLVTNAFGQSWCYGDETTVCREKEIAHFRKVLQPNTDLSIFFQNANYGIIAIGTASKEGQDTNETYRAGLRADRLRQAILQSQFKFGKTSLLRRVFTLNLGKFVGDSNPDFCGEPESGADRRPGQQTRCQRAVILIAIADERVELKEGEKIDLGVNDRVVNHQEALKAAMRQLVADHRLPYDFEKDFKHFRLIEGPQVY